MNYSQLLSLEAIEGSFTEEDSARGWTTLGLISFDGYSIYQLNAAAALVRIGVLTDGHNIWNELIQPNLYQYGIRLTLQNPDPRYRLVPRTTEQEAQDLQRTRAGIYVLPGLFTFKGFAYTISRPIIG